MQLVVVIVCALSASLTSASKEVRSPLEYFRYPERFQNLLATVTSPTKDFTHARPLEVVSKQTGEPASLLDYFEKETGFNLKGTECKINLDLAILDFLDALRLRHGDTTAFEDFKMLAEWKLEKCAREFDMKLSNNYGFMLEWSMDKFFNTLSGLDKEATEEKLFMVASQFDFERRHIYLPSSDYDGRTICQLAGAFNQLKQMNKDSWVSMVMVGFARVGWYSRPQLSSLLDKAMKTAMPENCRSAVETFFTSICRADNLDHDNSLQLINLAVALGIKPASIMGARTRKFREYKRICYRTGLRTETGFAQLREEIRALRD